MKEYKPKQCAREGCETVFVPRSSRSKYCDLCKPIIQKIIQKEHNEARPRIGDITCKRCGNVFERNGSRGWYCKECKLIVARGWGREGHRKWKAEHREHNRKLNREYSRQIYKTDIENGRCPDCHGQRDSNFVRCDACREQHNRSERIAREQNQERRVKRSEYGRKYLETHADAMRVHTRNRRARIRGNGGTLPPNVEKILFEEQVGLCYLCGELLYNKFDDMVCVEHKFPVSRGGPNTIENVALAHMRCNLKKGTKTHEEFLQVKNGIKASL